MKKEIIYIISGESSGELHGSKVMTELKKMDPELQFKGIGGDKMIAEGLTPLFHVKELSFMGLVEVLNKILFIKKVTNVLLENIIKDKPKAILLIDFSEFNLRFSQLLRHKKIPIRIIRYVSPQIWASRPKRITKVVETYDALCCILPFEEKIYKRYDPSFDIRYVGHPLLEQYIIKYDKNEFLNKFKLDKDNKIIAIFPGSRHNEINKHMDVLLKSVIKYKKRIGFEKTQFLLCKSREIVLDKYEKEIAEAGIITADSENNWEIMQHSDFIWCKSGTTTLQAALTETPALIFYNINWLTYQIAKMIITIKFIGLMNIIADKEIYPELIQHDFCSDKIIETTDNFLNDNKKYQDTISELKKIKTQLGEKGAAKRVAETVYEYFCKS